MSRPTFTFYCDPGHAWLKVSLALLEELDLVKDVHHPFSALLWIGLHLLYERLGPG